MVVKDKSGGVPGSDKILFYTDFSGYDTETGIDTPLVGEPYELKKASYISLTKKENALVFTETDNLNQSGVSCTAIYGASKVRAIFELSATGDNRQSFIFFSFDDVHFIFGISFIIVDGDKRVKTLVRDTVQNLITYNITNPSVDTFTWYEITFNVTSHIVLDFEILNGTALVSANGNKLFSFDYTEDEKALFVHPSPRNLSSTSIQQICGFK